LLYKTRALSLNSFPQGDSNKVIELYTEEYGKINGIANGIRKSVNRFGSVFEPVTLSKVVLYKSNRSDLYTIRSGELINHFPNLKSSYEWLQVVFDFIGKLRKSIGFNEIDPAFFNAVISLLENFNHPKVNLRELHLKSRLLLLSNMGQLPDWNRCSFCGKQEKTNFISLEGVLCANCFYPAKVKGQKLAPDLQKIFSFIGNGLEGSSKSLSISESQYNLGLRILDFLWVAQNSRF